MADFKQALEKARTMIHSDAKRDAHIIKERVADRNDPKYFADQPADAFSSMSSAPSKINEEQTDNFNFDADNLDSALNDIASEYKGMRENKKVVVPNSNSLANIRNSKMPKAILESLSENYIDQSGMYDGGLSGIVSETMNEMEPVQPTQVHENRTPIKETVQASGIDYSLIKTIVEDCVRKYAATITKKVISEQKSMQSSENALKAIKIGENFTFITSNGDLYEAELKFKKNLNKQVKKGN